MLTTSAFVQLVPSALNRIIANYRTSERLALPITLNYLKDNGVDEDLVESLTSRVHTPYEERLLSALILIELFGNSMFLARAGLTSWLARQNADDEIALRLVAKQFADELRRRDLHQQYASA